MSWKIVLRYIAAPLILLLLYLLFILTYRGLGLPSAEEIIQLAQQYYAQYGYLVVFIGALLEGLLAVNWYLPGSTVIVLGVVYSQQAGLNIGVLVGIVVLGFLLTMVIDYWLGYLGWYRLMLRLGLGKALNNLKPKVEKHGVSVVLVTYVHPNLGAVTATMCGILRIPFAKFVLYSLVALVAWNTAWAIIVYLLGPAILNLLSTWLVIPLLILWLLISFIRARNNKEKK